MTHGPTRRLMKSADAGVVSHAATDPCKGRVDRVDVEGLLS